MCDLDFMTLGILQRRLSCVSNGMFALNYKAGMHGLIAVKNN